MQAILLVTFTRLIQLVPAAYFSAIVCGNDCTEQLQEALDSGARHILVRAPSPSRLRSVTVTAVDVVLELARGTELVGFLNHSATYSPALSQFRIRSSSNFSLVGNDATLRQVTLTVGGGSKGITISGLNVLNPGWDGLYVRGVTDLVLRDVVFDRPYRNGISVIDVAGMLVENCTFSNSLPNGTGRISPMAGVDLEPNRPTDRLANITFRQCWALNNSGAGFQVFPHALDSTSMPLDISFVDCHVRGIGIKPLMFPIVPDGFYFNAWDGHGVRGAVRVIGGSVRETASFGAAVYAHGSNDAHILFYKTRFGKVALHEAPMADNHSNCPLVVAWLGSKLEGHALGGVTFADIEVTDDKPRPFLFVDGKGSVGIEKVDGQARVYNPHSEGCSIAVVPEKSSLAVRRNWSVDCHHSMAVGSGIQGDLWFV